MSDSDMAIDLIHGDVNAGLEAAETPKPFRESVASDFRAGIAAANITHPFHCVKDAVYGYDDRPRLAEDRDAKPVTVLNMLALDKLQLSADKYDAEEVPEEGSCNRLREPGDDDADDDENAKSHALIPPDRARDVENARGPGEVLDDTEATMMSHLTIRIFIWENVRKEHLLH